MGQYNRLSLLAASRCRAVAPGDKCLYCLIASLPHCLINVSS